MESSAVGYSQHAELFSYSKSPDMKAKWHQFMYIKLLHQRNGDILSGIIIEQCLTPSVSQKQGENIEKGHSNTFKITVMQISSD